RYPEAEAWRRLEAAGPAASLRESGRLVAVGREQAFQAGGPRIHHDHVAAVVQDSLDAAKAKGLGLSILADASHAYFQEGRSQEWFAFESWLGARLAHDVALVCLYWEGDLQDPAILDGMMRTHLSRLGSSSVYPIDPGA
ncbi:MAG TPA: hypothetical protein VFH47_00290, partial [Candidatus Thermoplasmatota archaeon]|nr:hypothetical protein [Candidatus Thermoplasmatota archaeon]